MRDCSIRVFLYGHQNLSPLFGGYFYCVHYLEVISIVSIWRFYCVHYLEVISIVSTIWRLFLLCPLFGGYFYCTSGIRCSMASQNRAEAPRAMRRA